jgi:S-methylmethionine-dependent homocysteine/selenocysteine methylase
MVSGRTSAGILYRSHLPDKPVLLDGGLGRELRFRGVAVPNTIWSAAALMADPAVVRQIHLDYITAGADVITTNTYGVIRSDLAKEVIEAYLKVLKVSAAE